MFGNVRAHDSGVHHSSYAHIALLLQRLNFVKSCAEGNIEALQISIDRGECTESTDMQGNTGMHVAAAVSNIAVMEFLLQNNADKEARNKNVSSERETPTKQSNQPARRKMYHTLILFRPLSSPLTPGGSPPPPSSSHPDSFSIAS